MKQLITTISGLLLLFSVHAQTWSDDAASIVYNKCAQCHHSGGIAPFSLMSYTEVSAMASEIHDAIVADEMPPWPPDNNYQQYVHTRSLSASEKATMVNWLTNGYPEGNPANTPPPPVFNSGSILGNGDLTIQIPTYMSKAQGGQDDYVCFSIPVGLAQQRTIRAMEIIPGNREIVHHALIYIDETGTYQTDTIGGDCMGPDAKLISGYTPGATPLVFPSAPGFKLGMNIPTGSNIVFAMHYPEGSYGEYDSTKVIFHFYPTNEVGIRQVSADPVLENWALSLPPNQITTAQAFNNNVPSTFTVLSVFPHMHLIGESIKAYGLDPQNDTIKFIDIHHWDFHWQDFYFFRYPIKVPVGTDLRATATFNNTVNNPHNPSNPPVHVYAGEATNDEMMLVYMHYMLYQNGDENQDLENLMSVGLTDLTHANNPEWRVYPLPFSDQVTIINLAIEAGDVISLYIYDMQGKVVRKLAEQVKIETGFTGFTWDGASDAGAIMPKGTYMISMNRNGVFGSTMIIKQ